MYRLQYCSIYFKFPLTAILKFEICWKVCWIDEGCNFACYHFTVNWNCMFIFIYKVQPSLQIIKPICYFYYQILHKKLTGIYLKRFLYQWKKKNFNYVCFLNLYCKISYKRSLPFSIRMQINVNSNLIKRGCRMHIQYSPVKISIKDCLEAIFLTSPTAVLSLRMIPSDSEQTPCPTQAHFI